MMSKPQSVTQWIDDLKKGDEDAAAQLWERYFAKMVVAARHKLKRHTLAVADEEDVALSAFDSLCRGALKGNFWGAERPAGFVAVVADDHGTKVD